jgi:hypothetical protein
MLYNCLPGNMGYKNEFSWYFIYLNLTPAIIKLYVEYVS